jgi:hypothetical protein
MSEEITIEQLREMARRAGLDLPDSELELIFPGVRRALKQAAELRQIFSAANEPAATFRLKAGR